MYKELEIEIEIEIETQLLLKKRVKQCAVVSGSHLGGCKVARLPV